MKSKHLTRVRILSVLAAYALLMPCAMAKNSPAAPASTPTLDLSTAGSSGFINDAFFQQVPNQTTGTGVIEPFLRLQDSRVEEGFNTDTKNVLDNKDGIWTHSILLSQVPVVSLNGVSYFQVLLDINENQGSDNEYLSLDALQVFQETRGDVGSFADLTNKRYDLDTGSDNWIKLNYALNPGSGAGDMFAYIPTVNFQGTTGYFVLYSKFGLHYGSDAGFEEWATVKVAAPPPPIPEPSTYALMFAGLAAVGFVARRRRQA